MGIFQIFTRPFFLAKCVAQMQHVLPPISNLAEKFCAQNANDLARARSEGFSVAGSVNVVCMYILDSPERYKNGNLGTANLIIASNYALAYLALWPNDGASQPFKESLERFAAYAGKSPILEDLQMHSGANATI